MPPRSMSGLIIKLRNRVISVAACQSANSTGSNKHGEVIKSAGGEGVEAAVTGWPPLRVLRLTITTICCLNQTNSDVNGGKSQ